MNWGLVIFGVCPCVRVSVCVVGFGCVRCVCVCVIIRGGDVGGRTLLRRLS